MRQCRRKNESVDVRMVEKRRKCCCENGGERKSLNERRMGDTVVARQRANGPLRALGSSSLSLHSHFTLTLIFLVSRMLFPSDISIDTFGSTLC